jgi:hypothetical protein
LTEVVVVKELNGVAPGTATALTSITGRYCTIDSATPGTTNPCKVPTSDFYYSYWKSMFLAVSGTFNSIRDIYWYCDGNVATDWGLDSGNGGGLYIGKRDTGDNGCPYASYVQATGTPGTTGDAIGHVSNGHTYYRGQTYPTHDVDSYTAATPLLIDSTVYTSGFNSKIWVTQLKIAPTSSHGELASKSFNLSYQVY